MRGGGRLLGDTGHRPPQDRAKVGLGRCSGERVIQPGAVSGGSAGLQRDGPARYDWTIGDARWTGPFASRLP
jgi:hypothetical protein